VHSTLPQVEAHFVRELQMTMVELDMLAVLAAAADGLPMSSLSRYLTVSPASVTRTASQLELAGYLRRVNSTVDRRVVLAVITASGVDVVERARPVAEPALEEAIGRHYSLGELQSLRDLLARLLPYDETAQGL
jgi:DNA-binding MarR family transcriptional regulator